jgi:parvulin-like peptidyl-prolyl isomerase
MNRNAIKARFVILSIAAIAAPLSATETDQVAATVNGQPIYLSAFQRTADPIMNQFLQTAPSKEQTRGKVNEIKKQVLDQMIDDQLLVQQTRIMDIYISSQEVDEAVKKARSQFKTEEGFNRSCARKA